MTRVFRGARLVLLAMMLFAPGAGAAEIDRAAADFQIPADIKWIRNAMRLNPYHPERFWQHLGRAFFVGHRYGEAIDAFRRVSRADFAVACSGRVAKSERYTGGAERTRVLDLSHRDGFGIGGRLRAYLSGIEDHRRLAGRVAGGRRMAGAIGHPGCAARRLIDAFAFSPEPLPYRVAFAKVSVGGRNGCSAGVARYPRLSSGQDTS